MADRRTSRTRLPEIRVTGRPTVQDQMVGRAVPKEQGPGFAGMDALRDTFGQFFGQLGNVGLTLMAAGREVERIEAGQDLEDLKIQKAQERKDIGTQAALDAEKGRADPTKMHLRDYADVYQSTLGTNAGVAAAQKWYQEVVSNASPDTDLDAATAKWAKENLQPTGSDVRDLFELSTFNKAITKQVAEFKQNQIRAQRAAGLESAHSALVGRLNIDGASPQILQNAIDAFRTLDPMDPTKAAGRAVSAMIDWAQQNPTRAAEVDRVLRAPGFGPNGGAVIDLPGMADQALRLGELYQRGLTLQGDKAYNTLRDRVNEINDGPGFVSFIHDLEKAREAHGGEGRYLAVKQQFESRLLKWQEKEVAANRMVAMVGGQLPVDPSEVRKNFGELLSRTGLDLGKNPAEIARIVTRLGEMDDATKHTYSQWMIDNLSPERQMSAITFWQGIEGRLGREAVMSMIPSAAQDFYLAYSDMARTDPAATMAILSKLNENRDALKDARSIGWSRLMGTSSDKDGEKDADTLIKRTLGELDPGLIFNGDVRVDEATLKQLRDSLKVQMVLRQRDGSAMGKDDLKSIVRSHLSSSKFEAIPGENDKLTLRSAARMPDLLPDGSTRVAFGTQVFNPLTKQPESTVDTYRTDLSRFKSAAPGLFDGVSVNPNDPVLATHGVYGIQRHGLPLVLELGQTVRINGKDVVLGAGADTTAQDGAELEMRTQLEMLAPGSGFKLIPERDPATGRTVYLVGYRPRFATRPQTAEQREGSFTRSNVEIDFSNAATGVMP
jgi:hypothetical protein